jgi:hypothetical protein
MSQAPHRVRLSPALAALLSVVGSNSSAAHRALLLLGAHAAGYDLSTCRSDIGRLLGEELDEPVQQRLATLYELCRTKGGQLEGTVPTPVLPSHHPPVVDAVLSEDADPFASVGIEV